MNIKKTYILLIFSILTHLIGFSQDADTGWVDTTHTRFYFAANLQQSMAGHITQYAILEDVGENLRLVTFLSESDFILQMQGRMKSKANPNNIDYLKAYHIDWRMIDGMWKLRYQEYPYKREEDTQGWSTMKYVPSKRQLAILKQYGLTDITSFIYGKNLIRLLQDMAKPEWVSNYKGN